MQQLPLSNLAITSLIADLIECPTVFYALQVNPTVGLLLRYLYLEVPESAFRHLKLTNFLITEHNLSVYKPVYCYGWTGPVFDLLA